MRDCRTNRSLLTALLVLGDVALLNLSFWASYQLLIWFGYPSDVNTYLALQWYTWTLPPIAFYLSGMYRRWDEYAFSKGIDSIITGVIVSAIVLVVAIWFGRDEIAFISHLERANAIDERTLERMIWGVPVRVLVMVVVLSPLLIWAFHLLANELEYRLIGWSARVRRVVLIGALPEQDILRLSANRRPAYDIIGQFVDRRRHSSAAEWLGDLRDLPRRIQQLDVQEAFVVGPDLSRKDILSVLDACASHGVAPRLVLGVQEALLSATQPILQNEVPLYRYKSGGIRGWTLVVKRLMDVVLAGIGLAVTAPLFILPACVAIVIDSKGWPVFAQTRVGLHGRHFRLYKLRTMVIDADLRGGPLTTDNDPRITRIGRFLRKTSIDELPQLWNVLKGDMSLVGPRAVVPYVADGFRDWERVSLAVRPGVTGLAQISGRDEIGFFEKSLLNLYYVRNHSILLDVRIVVDTVAVVLSMEGTEGTRGAKA